MKSLTGVELKRFLRDYRRSNPPTRQVAAVLHSVAYPYNVGSIFRLADGARMSELVLSGITPTPPHPTIDKVGRYKAKNVPWRYEPDPITAIEQLKAAGYCAVALELVDIAAPYQGHQYTERTCLVVGNEDHGITKAVLNVCDEAVFVPMYGKGRSLNVHTALAIVTYHILHSQ
ncbi:MAG: TrmH family RNA methyltransferase [Chloroflexota bacterium]